MSLTQKDILLELARRDMKYFIKYTHKDYIFSKFSIIVIEALNNFLNAIENEKRPILIIQAPPQHGKSELASRKFPAFAFGKNPHYRIAGCSYNSDLATSMNRDIQRIMLEDNYSDIFPNSSLNKKRIVTVDNQPLRNSERFDIVDHRGYYVGTGVGGALTGKSVDIGIIDDPTKNMQEARSETIKATLISWYQTVFLTRLSKNSGQLIIATRWTLDDLIGYIIKQNKDNNRVKILKFPAINENNEALIPELHPLEQLLEQKNSMDMASWSALYQQEPIIQGGNVIKTTLFSTYRELPNYFESVYIVCDTAFSTKTTADNSAFMCVGLMNNRLYIIDLYCAKVGFVELKNNLKAFYEKYKTKYTNFSTIYIENKASGQSLLQEFISYGLPVSELYPSYYNSQMKKELTADKLTRYYEIEADILNGYVYIPETGPWLYDFIRECQQFTGTGKELDDRVDCLIYALKIRRKRTSINWNNFKKVFTR